VSKKMADLINTIKTTLVEQDERRRKGDALLALRLANEGTRRASTLSGH
jgi:hypothetical protein